MYIISQYYYKKLIFTWLASISNKNYECLILKGIMNTKFELYRYIFTDLGVDIVLIKMIYFWIPCV